MRQVNAAGDASIVATDVAVATVVVMASKIPINARYSISFHYVLSLPFSNINR